MIWVYLFEAAMFLIVIAGWKTDEIAEWIKRLTRNWHD